MAQCTERRRRGCCCPHRCHRTPREHLGWSALPGAERRKTSQQIVLQAKRIENETGVETRATILGHVQRGGHPTVRDRVTASLMGHKAVELLKEGIGNRVIAMQHDEIVDFDIFEALNMKKTLDLSMYKIAHEISI